MHNEPKSYAHLYQMLDEHDTRLRNLDTRLDQLARPKRGGFPLRLLLLAAGGYYVYQRPELRQKVTDFIQNVTPGAQGNPGRMENPAAQAPATAPRGESPGPV